MTRPRPQLALSQPTRRVRAERMTERQHELVRLARAGDVVTTAQAVGLGYQRPSAALRRLCHRGLLSPLLDGVGVYGPTMVGERRTNQPRGNT